MAFKALLVGINRYPGAPLKGCVNDVLAMRKLVEQRHGGTHDGIRVLLNKEATTDAILEGLAWLAQGTGTGSGETRLFQFSGHGTFVADRSGDEPDGRDECIVPYDYNTKGFLKDDTLREAYKRFKKKTHVLLVMDSCHSGTVQKDPVLDRTYRFLKPSRDEIKRSAAAKQAYLGAQGEYVDRFVEEKVATLGGKPVTAGALAPQVKQWVKDAIGKFEKSHYGLERVGGNIVLIAGCQPDQTSADAKFGAKYQGALTYYLLKAMRKGPMPYKSLVEQVGDSLLDNDFTQVPQLECSKANQACGFLNAALGG